MTSSRRGSAASAKALPGARKASHSAEETAALHRSIEQLDLAVSLARSAARVNPGRAALLLATALDDLRGDLRAARAAAKRHLSDP